MIAQIFSKKPDKGKYTNANIGWQKYKHQVKYPCKIYQCKYWLVEIQTSSQIYMCTWVICPLFYSAPCHISHLYKASLFTFTRSSRHTTGFFFVEARMIVAKKCICLKRRIKTLFLLSLQSLVPWTSFIFVEKIWMYRLLCNVQWCDNTIYDYM